MLSSVFLLSLAALGFSAPCNEKQQLAPVVTSYTAPNTVALTFDDGPYQYMKNIVDLLNANNSAGTFFLNGNNYGCIYDIDNTNNISYAYNHGHQIASHTWAHRDLTLLTQDEINSEMELTEDALVKITGATPAFTRPPYGNHNNIVVEVAGSRGQSLVIWDFDTEDSEGAPVDKQKSSIDDLIARHPQSILSLEHEVYETTAHEVLPYYISRLRSAGYRMVTLSECLGGSFAYKSVSTPATRDVGVPFNSTVL